MKQTYLFIFLLFASIATSQDLSGEMCGTDLIHAQMLENVQYRAKMEAFDSRRTLRRTTTQINEQPMIVPVVVHILHTGTEIGTGMNLTNEEVQSRIDQLNQIFRNEAGIPEGLDIGIQFALAVRDPEGNCTNGIDRIDMSGNPNYMNFGVNYAQSSGLSNFTMKALYGWDTSQYYNVYVVNTIDNQGSVSGFANLAAAHGQSNDGMVAKLSMFLGSPLSVAHEMGHALNLYHTFEGDGNGTACPPVNGCGIGLGDCCDDIPSHNRVENQCVDSNINACQEGTTAGSFIHNLLSYVGNNCRNRFSQDQKDRMIAALTEIRGSYLQENGNLALVPVSSVTPEFTSANILCAGEVTFRDETFCVPNLGTNGYQFPGIEYLWTISGNDEVLTSTDQNPTFTVNPGIYSISNTITINGVSNNTVHENVIVIPSAAETCVPLVDTPQITGLAISRVTFGNMSQSSSGIFNPGYTNFKCNAIATVTELETYQVEIRGSDAPNLQGINAAHFIKGFIDYNNDQYFSDDELIVQGIVNEAEPLIATIVIPAGSIMNEMLTMRIVSDLANLSAGNPITEAHVNCNAYFNWGGEVEDYGILINPILSIVENTASGIKYTNPVHDQFSINSENEVDSVQLYSITGQLIYDHSHSGKNISIDISDYADGIYFVKVQSDNRSTTLKIIKN